MDLPDPSRFQKKQLTDPNAVAMALRSAGISFDTLVEAGTEPMPATTADEKLLGLFLDWLLDLDDDRKISGEKSAAEAVGSTHLPEEPSLPGEGLYYITTPKRDALDAWKRLRALTESNGLYPLIIGQPQEVFWPSLNDDPNKMLASATHEAVSAHIESIETEYGKCKCHGDWPLDYKGLHVPAFGTVFTDLCVEVALTLVPGRCPAEAIANFWCGQNPPEAHVVVAFIDRWHQKYGAELICLSGEHIELLVQNPPKDRASAIELAHECWAFCMDIEQTEHVIGISCETMEDIATYLMNSTVWYFWWD